MRLGKFLKSPAEIKRYKLEYRDWLDTGEYCASVTFSVTPVSAASPLYVIADTIAASSTAIAFVVSGGAVGAVYTVVIRMTTTGNQVKEDTISFVVRDAA